MQLFNENLLPAPASGKKIRVLVVDDSALMRKLIAEILSGEPDIEVVGTARDGEDGLTKVRELRPDVVTLDVEMPRLDGLGFLEAQMREHPLPVVMVSSLTQEGADTALACLQRGAVDYVGKPSGSISLDIAAIGEALVSKVRGAAAAKVRPPRTASPGLIIASAGKTTLSSLSAGTAPLSSVTGARSAGKSGDFSIVVIASSTGGPAALHEILPYLDPSWNAAYLLVQHLPQAFTRIFAERLNAQCALNIREAAAGDSLERGTLLLAPGGHHLELDAQGRVVFSDAPTLWGVRPAADIAMCAAAARFGTRTVGVVLTGMGRDGAKGAKAIQAAGGICLAQDAATSVVYGMPGEAVEAGGISRIVPLPGMADALREIIGERSGAEIAPRKRMAS